MRGCLRALYAARIVQIATDLVHTFHRSSINYAMFFVDA